MKSITTGRFFFNRAVAASFLLLLFAIIAGCAAKQPGFGSGSYLHVRSDEARASGIKAFARGDTSLALTSFDTALKIDRAIDDKESEVLDLINIARVSIAVDDLVGAESYLKAAIRIGLESKSVQNLGAAYATLAKVEYLTGRYAPALVHVNESIRIDKEHGVKSGAALNLLGSILAGSGRTTEAHGVLKRALALNAKHKDALEEANSYRSLGHLHAVMKRHDKAVEQYRLAYELDKKAGNPVKIALDLSSLAALHSRSGHLPKAAYLLERSFVVNLNSGSRLEAIATLTLLIHTYEKLGNTERVEYFSRIKGSLVKSYEEGKALQREGVE